MDKGKTKIKKEKKYVFLPKTLLGRKLPTGINDDDRKMRKLAYFKEALVFGIVMIILDIVLLIIPGEEIPILINNKILNVILCFVIDFLILVATSYLFDYAVGESNVRHYNIQEKNKKEKK